MLKTCLVSGNLRSSGAADSVRWPRAGRPEQRLTDQHAAVDACIHQGHPILFR